MTNNRGGSAKMRPRARIISLIGEELISDEPVAIVELVKNSYDADANKVVVRFDGNNPERPDRIIVEDDGIGMDVDTVLNCWFEPGTISKKRAKRSPGRRLYQGAKGIGRFAAGRLAEQLYLESTVTGSSDSVFVILDWGRFDDESYLDEIEIDYEIREKADLASKTKLTLEKLRKSEWNEEDYEKLNARLTRLVSPFDEISDFDIFLEIPGYPQFSGRVQPPELILGPKYLLKGRVDEYGGFAGEIYVDGKPYKEFVDYRLGPKNHKPLCGSFELEVRAWDRDPDGLEPFMLQHNIGINEIRNTLNNFCGVSIYRDGFRVHPYGETGNDWLKLDNRSRQNPVRNLANNQVVASVKISRENNPGLRDRSTREGMVYNDDHLALESWFKYALSLLEEERYRIRPRREEVDQVDPLFESLDIAETVREVRKELGRDHKVARLLTDTEKQMRTGTQRIQDVFSRLLLSSGRGQMVDLVIHEVGAPLGKINRQIALIERKMEERCHTDIIDQFNPKILNIKGWLEQIHTLRDRLAPQTPDKRGRATSFPVHEEIEDNIELYSALIDKQKIDCVLDLPTDSIRVRMSRGSLGQILANLLDNSIYWLVDQKGSSNGGHIHIKLDEIEHGFRLVVSDDGPGVAQEDQIRIFEPYFSTKRGGKGMGLGLYICRLVVEPYGKIIYRDGDGHLPGACFEILFEKKVGL